MIQPTPKHKEEAREPVPCPCGRNAKVEEFYNDDDPQSMFLVTCEVCPIKTYDQFSAQEAITIWNTHVSSRDTQIREILSGFIHAGVEFDDPRMDYVVMQIDRRDLDAARELYDQVQPK